MKKYLFVASVIAFTIVLTSWGFTGHEIIGQIASNHLTPRAKEAVHELLDGQSLADVSTWADQVRGDPAYKGTAPWHFINVPLGLSFAQFQEEVSGADKINVYTALLREEKQLSDSASTHQQKTAALRFIVHLVGDLHQPMHVSRAEDKGGNTIQLNYEGRGTNLHTLWDTKLLEHGGLNYVQLASQYDHPTAAEIKQWQGEPPIVWAWESYQISSKLYGEVGTMKNRTIDDSYYSSHIAIVQDRILRAGIRLAGILNVIFKDAKPGAYSGPATPVVADLSRLQGAATVALKDLPKHIGENVEVCGKVYGQKDFGSMILVNVGGAYPYQLLTIVLRDKARVLAQKVGYATVCVTGKVVDYKGKPEIIVTDPGQVN